MDLLYTLGIGIALLALLAAVVGSTFAWRRRRAHEICAAWAERHGYDILRAEFQWFWRGPFWWRSSDGQAVLRIQVLERDGRTRRGWLRCGGWIVGLFGSSTAVEWDDD